MNSTVSTESVTSKDGTRIGYRRIGLGPGIVLVQGAMGTVENFTELARCLSDSYTVYVPERRGRGISPLPFTKDYTIQKDVEDLEALLNKTQAQYVFGLSSGAIIALEASLKLPAIRKVAVYEPALFVNGVPTKALSRFYDEMAKGRTAAALVTAMKAAQMGPPMLAYVPSAFLAALTKMMMSRAKKKGSGSGQWMNEAALSLQYDFEVVSDMSPKWQTFHNITIEVLLLGGSKSPKYLKTALDSLEPILPKSKRHEFVGLDHGSAWDYDKRRNAHGNPKQVAQELRKFFD